MKPLTLKAGHSSTLGNTMPVPVPDVLCSWCGRERMSDGAWISDAGEHPYGVSHTACPECSKSAIKRMLRDLMEAC